MMIARAIGAPLISGRAGLLVLDTGMFYMARGTTRGGVGILELLRLKIMYCTD